MIIRCFTVNNFKSITESGPIELHSNFNIIVGKNNAGKTALIEALYRCFSGTFMHPGQTGGTGTFNGIQSPASSPVIVTVEVCLSNDEQSFYESVFQYSLEGRWLKFIFHSFEGYTYFESISSISPKSSEQDKSLMYKGIEPSNNHYYLFCSGDSDVRFGDLPMHTISVNRIYNDLVRRVNFISAERRIPEHQNYEYVNKLDATASKLPAYLLYFALNKSNIFALIVDSFRNIFSEVESLSTETFPNGAINIQIKFRNNKDSIPIQQCGSGYYHVLILLSLLHNEEEGLLILVDEPNSYLHPSAEKAIYDVICTFEKQQFIFTSHSPILINYPTEKFVYLATKNNEKSEYKLLDQVGPALLDVGVRNSDFAFSDKLIFVEGETEKSQLPIILKHFGIRQIGYNYNIIQLKGTGDEFLREKYMAANAEIFQDIFNTISSNPVPYIFLLDRDERKFKLLTDKYGIGNIELLKKREFENYLLDEDAISHFIKEFDKKATTKAIKEYILELLEKERTNKKYFPKGLLTGNPFDDVKASCVLDSIVKTFISADYSYSKPKHGAILVKWILENKADSFKEIIELFNDFF